MSWLLKDANVLSSAVVFTPKARAWPWERGSVLTREQSVVLQGRHLLHSFLSGEKVLVVVCDKEMNVTSLRSLAPNRIGGLTFRSGAIVMIPARVSANFDIHVGDKLELRG
ncbi:MAG: hypothetical protein M0Z34_03690 [Nitrospiraceae bacterium]|nr:hypothetical protein [Nitrospiraceae bacterium]